jgi:hypothetical protein
MHESFRCQSVRRGCDEYDIKKIFRPIARPHFGGHIERLIGNLMGRVHFLPGTTSSSVAARGSDDPKNTATMTIYGNVLKVAVCCGSLSLIPRNSRSCKACDLPRDAWKLGFFIALIQQLFSGVIHKVAAGQCRAHLAGASPAQVAASHGSGIEPCRRLGDGMLDA